MKPAENSSQILAELKAQLAAAKIVRILDTSNSTIKLQIDGAESSFGGSRAGRVSLMSYLQELSRGETVKVLVGATGDIKLDIMTAPALQEAPRSRLWG